jgi:hypothetical protein
MEESSVADVSKEPVASIFWIDVFLYVVQKNYSGKAT